MGLLKQLFGGGGGAWRRDPGVPATRLGPAGHAGPGRRRHRGPNAGAKRAVTDDNVAAAGVHLQPHRHAGDGRRRRVVLARHRRGPRTAGPRRQRLRQQGRHALRPPRRPLHDPDPPAGQGPTDDGVAHCRALARSILERLAAGW